MAQARRTLAGELVAHLIQCIPAGVWRPDLLPKKLNPFADEALESKAMRAHKARLKQLRLNAALKPPGLE